MLRRLACAAALAMLGCGSSGSGAPPAGPPRASYDPSAGCQRALAHVVTLAIQATGSGPTDQQRARFLRACVATGSDRAAECVMRLKRLPGRRGGPAELGPAHACCHR